MLSQRQDVMKKFNLTLSQWNAVNVTPGGTSDEPFKEPSASTEAAEEQPSISTEVSWGRFKNMKGRRKTSSVSLCSQ